LLERSSANSRFSLATRGAEVYLATPSRAPPARHYGIYGLSGLETIQLRDDEIPAAEEAMQLATGNRRIAVHVIPPTRMGVFAGQLGIGRRVPRPEAMHAS
jgi:hypothetical protein